MSVSGFFKSVFPCPPRPGAGTYHRPVVSYPPGQLLPVPFQSVDSPENRRKSPDTGRTPSFGCIRRSFLLFGSFPTDALPLPEFSRCMDPPSPVHGSRQGGRSRFSFRHGRPDPVLHFPEQEYVLPGNHGTFSEAGGYTPHDFPDFSDKTLQGILIPETIRFLS